MKSSKIREYMQEAIVDHLYLESRCLKAFQLNEVESLRMISSLSKQIVNYQDEHTAIYLQRILIYLKKPMGAFLNQLALVSVGKKECLLPAIIVSNYQVDSSDLDGISDGLSALRKNLNTDSKSILRPIMELEIQINSKSLTDTQKATILANCLMKGLDLKEIQERLQLSLLIFRILIMSCVYLVISYKRISFFL
jgi:hypothetical protein